MMSRRDDVDFVWDCASNRAASLRADRGRIVVGERRWGGKAFSSFVVVGHHDRPTHDSSLFVGGKAEPTIKEVRLLLPLEVVG